MMLDVMEAAELRSGVLYLDAKDLPDGRYSYYADEIGRDVIVAREDVIKLGKMLNAFGQWKWDVCEADGTAVPLRKYVLGGIEMEPGEHMVYSEWCSRTSHDEAENAGGAS